MNCYILIIYLEKFLDSTSIHYDKDFTLNEVKKIAKHVNTNLNTLLVAFTKDGADVLEVGGFLVFLDLDGSRAFDDHLRTFLLADVRGAGEGKWRRLICILFHLVRK